MTTTPQRPGPRLAKKYTPAQIEAAYKLLGFDRATLERDVAARGAGVPLSQMGLSRTYSDSSKLWPLFQTTVETAVMRMAEHREAVLKVAARKHLSLNSLLETKVLPIHFPGFVYTVRLTADQPDGGGPPDIEARALCEKDIRQWTNQDLRFLRTYNRSASIGQGTLLQILTLATLCRPLGNPTPAAREEAELLGKLPALLENNPRRVGELKKLMDRWAKNPPAPKPSS